MEPDSRSKSLDPNRWSTNKRVKALGENIFGTKVRQAEGPKKVRPGDSEDTSANFQPAGKTPAEREALRVAEARAAKEKPMLEAESFLNEARKKLFKRGSMTQEEKEGLILLSRRTKGTRI